MGVLTSLTALPERRAALRRCPADRDVGWDAITLWLGGCRVPPAAKARPGWGADDGSLEGGQRLGLRLLKEDILDGQEQRQAESDHLLQVHAARQGDVGGSILEVRGRYRETELEDVV